MKLISLLRFAGPPQGGITVIPQELLDVETSGIAVASFIVENYHLTNFVKGRDVV